jgi:hypothetical protein
MFSENFLVRRVFTSVEMLSYGAKTTEAKSIRWIDGIAARAWRFSYSPALRLPKVISSMPLM